MIIDQLPNGAPFGSANEVAIEKGLATYKGTLAELVEAVIYLSENTYTINGVTFRFRKYGRVVVCTTEGNATSAISSSYMGSATVGAAYRPASSEIRYIQVTGSAVVQFNLNTAGVLQVGYATPDIAAGTAIRGTFVYISAA